MNHIALFLREIFFNGRSGQLIFKHAGIQKHLFFDKGHLIFAITNKPGERLGEILFKLGKISQDVFSKIENFIEPQQNLGEILLKKGLISERNLSDGLEYQMREITLNCFQVFNAEISFQEKKNLSLREPTLRIDTPSLIEDGLRLMSFQPAIKTYLQDKVPAPHGKVHAKLLTDEERELLTKIRGNQPAAILARSLDNDTDFFWKSLFLFYCLNLVAFAGEGFLQETKHRAEPTAHQEDSRNLLADLQELKEKMPQMNFYQLLNVSREASDDDIKKAYFHLARKFHPDRFDRSLWAEHRKEIDEVFDQVTKAYRTLSKSSDRKEYDNKLASGAPKEEVDLTKKADIRFRQAKTLFLQQKYRDAIVLLEESIRLNKNKPDSWLLLGMSEAKIPELRRKAEADFLKAQEMEPWNPEAFTGLGILYKEEGMTAKATKQFQKALEADSEHAVARKELSEFQKDDKKTGLKGILSNIFGQKKK